jgi:hypothetical protein
MENAVPKYQKDQDFMKRNISNSELELSENLKCISIQYWVLAGSIV